MTGRRRLSPSTPGARSRGDSYAFGDRLRQPGPPGRGRRDISRRDGGRCRHCRRARRRRAARVGRDPDPGARRDDRRVRRHPRRPQGRVRDAREPRGGQGLVEAGGDVQEAIDMAAYVAGHGRAAWGETVPCEMPEQDRLHDAPPGRRGRDDHAVELPGRDPVVEDLPRAARGQRRRDQAVRARARVLRGVRARVPRRGRPRRPRAGRARARRSRRRAHVHAGRARGHVHRLGADRPRSSPPPRWSTGRSSSRSSSAARTR